VRAAAEQTDPDVGEGERKTVTALFADIKGSTELAQDLGFGSVISIGRGDDPRGGPRVLQDGQFERVGQSRHAYFRFRFVGKLLTPFVAIINDEALLDFGRELRGSPIAATTWQITLTLPP
jgi:hypothetical protein